MATGWLTRFKNVKNPQLRLFCVPHAGSGTAAFRTWSASLPQAIDVAAVQLPGRETRLRETPYRHMTPMVQALAEALAPYLDVPYAIFGHSMGAWVAYELARQWQRTRGTAPVHLFVSGRRAPHLADPDAPLHRLADPEFLVRLQERYGPIPDIIRQDPELLAIFVPTLRADLELIETYVYEPGEPLACRISALGGSQDPRVSRENLAAWGAHTTRECDVRLFSGSHFYFQEETRPLWSAIVAALGPQLAPAAGTASIVWNGHAT